MEQIKIAIADDHKLHTEHAKNYLNRVTDLKVLELVHDGEDLFAYLEHTDELPDVFILDYRMPKFDPVMGSSALSKTFLLFASLC
jgi:DNA-binding NarL/FixJ family response regulator